MLVDTELDQIEERALRLPPEKRALLAERLLATLPPDEEAEQAWLEEAERRWSEIESGAVQPISEAEALRHLRNPLR